MEREKSCPGATVDACPRFIQSKKNEGIPQMGDVFSVSASEGPKNYLRPNFWINEKKAAPSPGPDPVWHAKRAPPRPTAERAESRPKGFTALNPWGSISPASPKLVSISILNGAAREHSPISCAPWAPFLSPVEREAPVLLITPRTNRGDDFGVPELEGLWWGEGDTPALG